MPLELQPPATPQPTPGFPEGAQLLLFDGYRTLNTKPSRPAIEDDEMSWCDNFMPLGKNNLRTLYDKGSALYTAPGGRTIKYHQFGNISQTSYCLVFLDDGSIVAVNVGTLAATTIATAGTINQPLATIGVSQWGSQYLLIVAPQPNGYFVWDGTLFYEPGGLGPTIKLLNAGTGYSSAPTIGFNGGHGSGATGTATVSGGSVTGVTITNPGSGYIINDAVVVTFTGGGLAQRTATATANISGGAIASVTVTDGGSGYTPGTHSPTAQAIAIGGGGTGATFTVDVSGPGGVTAVNVTNGGQGYLTRPTILIFDPNNPVAVATAILMPFGVSGTSIEVFSSRVWIANGDAPSTPPVLGLVLFSAPGSPIDFSSTDGAGAFVGTNSFLRVGYHWLKQSNGFLYLGGDSSVDYIAGVQTSGSPAITTFTNQNVDPQIGSPWPYSAQVFSRSIVFGNAFGIHGLYGGAVQKVSAPLDGIYATVTIDNSSLVMKPSSAVATIFGIHVVMMLMPIIDPLTNLQRNALLMWDGTRWWTASQTASLIQIASLEINSVLTAYGTDGSAIYPLFQTPSTGLTKIAQSKQWGVPGYIGIARMMRAWTLINQHSPSSTFTLTLDFLKEDNTAGSISYTLPATKDWLPLSIEATGVLIGFTLQTVSTDIALISVAGAARVEAIKI